MMNYALSKPGSILFCIVTLFFTSCHKEEDKTPNLVVAPPSSPASTDEAQLPCSNRPIIHARLVPIGSLSKARIGLVSATAGNKILFTGGMTQGAHSSRVDIYDTITKKWSAAELSIPERQGMSVASVGNKILFAGGGNNDDGVVTSRADIYDITKNTWSTAELSQGKRISCGCNIG
jgi:hypothetical protein